LNKTASTLISVTSAYRLIPHYCPLIAPNLDDIVFKSKLTKMPPAYTSQQKAAINDFVSITASDRTQAAKVTWLQVV
jgi:hypothetical protein